LFGGPTGTAIVQGTVTAIGAQSQSGVTYPAKADIILVSDSSNVIASELGANVRIQTSTTSAIALLVAGITNQQGDLLNVIASSTATSTPFFVVKANGNVGIGTTTPSFQLSTTGTVQFKGLTTSAGLQTSVLCGDAVGQVISDSVACLASARRYKTDIKPLSVGLEETLKLQPVEFKWTKAYNKGFEKDPNKNGVQYSLIADDTQKVDPKLATVDNIGAVHGLADLNHWVALFVQSFKDMEQQIVDMMFRVNTLEAENQSLKQQLNDQKAKELHDINYLQGQINDLKKRIK
jgi:hypothetical protein